jgi:hypothetical protein
MALDPLALRSFTCSGKLKPVLAQRGSIDPASSMETEDGPAAAFVAVTSKAQNTPQMKRSRARKTPPH